MLMAFYRHIIKKKLLNFNQFCNTCKLNSSQYYTKTCEIFAILSSFHKINTWRVSFSHIFNKVNGRVKKFTSRSLIFLLTSCS